MLQEPNSSEDPLVYACSHGAATVQRLNELTTRWHVEAVHPTGEIEQLHAANFELWHLEDLARDRRASHADIALTKRGIDVVNQRRNDTVEAIDAALLALLQVRDLPAENAPLNSETPGQMLDRLSILSLKRFHTETETERVSAGPEHREHNVMRLAVLSTQQNDLAGCLTALWTETESGLRRFKQYRQLKMYNDPALNPVLYATVQDEAAPPGPPLP